MLWLSILLVAGCAKHAGEAVAMPFENGPLTQLIATCGMQAVCVVDTVCADIAVCEQTWSSPNAAPAELHDCPAWVERFGGVNWAVAGSTQALEETRHRSRSLVSYFTSGSIDAERWREIQLRHPPFGIVNE